jgi:hypothetical protein
MNVHRTQAGRASHLDDRYHAPPKYTRAEWDDLEWEWRRRDAIDRQRAILVAGVVVIGCLGALAWLVWP